LGRGTVSGFEKSDGKKEGERLGAARTAGGGGSSPDFMKGSSIKKSHSLGKKKTTSFLRSDRVWERRKGGTNWCGGGGGKKNPTWERGVLASGTRTESKPCRKKLGGGSNGSKEKGAGGIYQERDYINSGVEWVVKSQLLKISLPKKRKIACFGAQK